MKSSWIVVGLVVGLATAAVGTGVGCAPETKYCGAEHMSCEDVASARKKAADEAAAAAAAAADAGTGGGRDAVILPGNN
jgi:hypothetical protein